MRRLFLFLSSLIVCVCLSVVADRLAGVLWPRQEPTIGLIFPRNAKYQFRTCEFSFSVETNSLGFRDREFEPGKTAKTRILTIGDSFTYGWGVEASQTWPKLLEDSLRTSGADVEIANLGQPGASPKTYADIAEKAVPLLKPDLLVIAVLEGDDLSQMEAVPDYGEQGGRENKRTVRHLLQGFAERLYPHFVLLMKERSKESLQTNRWKEDADSFISRMNLNQQERFEKLDPQVRESFLKGELNPALVYLSITKPDYWRHTLDPTSTSSRSLIGAMAKELERIKKVARDYSARVVVVSVPYGIYVSAESFKSRQRLGFSVAPEMLTANVEGDAIASASQMAGLRFYDFTSQFRSACVKSDLFFKLDGHFNCEGHRYFSEILFPVIQKALTEAEFTDSG